MISKTHSQPNSKTSYRVCQNLNVNLGSQSNTMLEGIPSCNLTTSLWDIFNMEIFKLNDNKYAFFTTDSTITNYITNYMMTFSLTIING